MVRDPWNSVSLGDLAADPAGVVERMASTDGVVAVTREGEPVAVLMSLPAFEQLRRDCERLRLLALGEIEAAAGEGHDLTAVIEDARSLLNEN